MQIIPFEVHITGDSSIIDELDKLNIKNIIVELLDRDYEVLRLEFMSSFIVKLPYCVIHQYVLDLVEKLKHCNIIRIKIECPPILELFPMSLYVESHFEPINNEYPLSRNFKSKKMMATDREYMKNNYYSFIDKWKDVDCELCVFDSFIEEDLDWFNLYKKQ